MCILGRARQGSDRQIEVAPRRDADAQLAIDGLTIPHIARGRVNRARRRCVWLGGAPAAQVATLVAVGAFGAP